MKYRLASSLMICVVCAALATAADVGSYAVCIGVNHCPNYEVANEPFSRPLQGAENDAVRFASLLQGQFGYPSDNVKLLVGREATYQGVQQALQWAASEIGKDDSFVLYFAGHGTQIADRRPYDELDELDEGICLYDYRGDGDRLLRDDTLGIWIDDLNARRVTVILDCCHSGTGIKSAEFDVVPRYLPSVKGANDRSAVHDRDAWFELRPMTKSSQSEVTAMFACQPDQQAYERRILDTRPPRRSGQFTHFLVEGLEKGLADSNHDGRVSAAEAHRFVSDRIDQVFNGTRRPATAKQVPLLVAPRTESDLIPIAGP